MHQANLRINERAQKELGLPDGKVYNNIQKYGNTTSGTLPIAFHEARQKGMAPEGSLVAFTALGRTQDLPAGRLLYLPPREPHAVYAVEASSLLVTIFRRPQVESARDAGGA